MNWYVLRERQVVAVPLEEWTFQALEERRVAEDTVLDARISTVFLGIRHAGGPDGWSAFFETMVFDGEHDGYQQRYATWDEAEAGHARLVDALRRGTLPLR